MRALHRLEAAARAEGDAAPDALLEALAHAAEGLEPEVAASSRELLAGAASGEQTACASWRSCAVVTPRSPRRRKRFAGGVTDAGEALTIAQADRPGGCA